MHNDQTSIWDQLIHLVKSKWFYKQLLFTLIGVVVIVLAIFMWLRFYTHHGQKLTLPDYTGMNIEMASKDAERKSFSIIVDDSVHMVGKAGGEVLSQNPEGNSKVKENRKIYVTVAKYQPDLISSANLPVLYGKSYKNKKEELSVGFEINLEVVGYKFDPGPPDHILEVRYKGDPIINGKGRNNNVSIEKGATLQVILSQPTGAVVNIPDVVCKDLDQARFIIETLLLQVSDIVVGDETNEGDLYVFRQDPPYDPERTMVQGEGIVLYVQKDKPDGCPNE